MRMRTLIYYSRRHVRNGMSMSPGHRNLITVPPSQCMCTGAKSNCSVTVLIVNFKSELECILGISVNDIEDREELLTDGEFRVDRRG